MGQHTAPRGFTFPRATAGFATLAAASAAAALLGTGAASAEPVKDCGTTTVSGHGSNTVYTTTTQTSACNSASDTGQQVTSVDINGGGNQPPGQQP